MKDPLAGQSFDSPRAARRAADILGCSGIHKGPDGWMPCASREDLDALIEGGVAAYRERNSEEKGLLGRAVKKAVRVRVPQCR
jgi:hypothetical protein